MPVAGWNDVRRTWLTGSWAQLVCSYFTRVQPCRLDLTHRNRTQVNTYCLLLSSFVCFHVKVKVSSLAFAIRNFRPYSSEFVSHVAAAVGLSSNQSPAKQQRREKRKANPVYEKESKQKVARQLKWAASVEERLWLTNDEAKSGICVIIHCWMHNLQVGGN